MIVFDVGKTETSREWRNLKKNVLKIKQMNKKRCEMKWAIMAMEMKRKNKKNDACEGFSFYFIYNKH